MKKSLFKVQTNKSQWISVTNRNFDHGLILTCLYAGILCVLSLVKLVANNEASVKIVLDILSFPGAVLLLLGFYKMYESEATGEPANGKGLYTPLNGEVDGSSVIDGNKNLTPFAKAGFFSIMSFWWLNPLMKKGKEKTLKDKDIPMLRKEDSARSCYSLFLEQLNLQSQNRPSTSPSILWTIVVCQWKGILIAGFFALIKILTMSAGPLLLNAFIEVAEGKEVFKYEGYVLALSLFVAKFLESLSQRRWYFHSRITGLQVRSLLSAAIFRKQMRLSNAARLMHSSGEIMNYVNVDVIGKTL